MLIMNNKLFLISKHIYNIYNNSHIIRVFDLLFQSLGSDKKKVGNGKAVTMEETKKVKDPDDDRSSEDALYDQVSK